jgi:hypothetical protein
MTWTDGAWLEPTVLVHREGLATLSIAELLELLGFATRHEPPEVA